MGIRFASPRDIHDVRHIWKTCFGDTEAYMDLYFSNMYQHENTLLYIKDGKAAGSLQFFLHEMKCGTLETSAAYIGGVAVLPAYRKCGIASALMEETEHILSERGIKLLFLVPATFSIYRRLGYAPFSCLSDITGKTKALLPFITDKKCIRESKDFPLSLYEKFGSDFDFILKRNQTEMYRALTLCENPSVVYTEDNAGYLIYKEENGLFLGLECLFKTESAFRELLTFIYSRREACPSFRLRFPRENKARRILFDSAFSETVYPHVMIKALDGITPSYSDKHYINMLGWF